MKWKFAKVCFLPIFGILLAVSASGQNITSTIVGQVNDSTGAALPAIHITVRNTQTGISVGATTNSTGFYSLSDLQTGMYELSAAAAGFNSYKQTGIVLQSAQIIRLDVVMKVGSISQTVLVSGATPLIQTSTATLGGTLNTTQITNIPSTYQNISSLYVAVPGDDTASAGVSNPMFAGTAHWGAVNYSLNGVSVNDPTNGGGAYTFGITVDQDLENLPPLDTLQEFRVLDVNENAEFRDVSSVLMVTKQGTNEFHGGLSEYFQNAVLNANTFLQNASRQPRAKNNLNQFGGTIGGPIVKNRAFFFFSPYYMREITSPLSQLNLPSAAMAGGDFSALLTEGTQLYNPFTGQPFANNRIPTTMFASQATALLKYLPAPSVTGSLGLPGELPNYLQSVPQYQSMSSYTIRGDYQLRSSDSLFGVYTHSIGDPWNVSLGGPPQYGNASNFGFLDESISATETHIFSATALNDFRATWFRHNSYREGVNTTFDPSSLFPQLTPGTNRGLPTISISGYNALFFDYGYSAAKLNKDYNVEFTDNFTKVLGNHVIKVGFDESGYKAFNPLSTGSLGSFSATGVWTGNKGWPSQPQSQGNPFADFLLGDVTSATRSTVSPNVSEYNRDFEAYAQDSWQTTPHLALYYGMRYMYQTPWNVGYNARSFYDVVNNKIALPQNSATPTLPFNGNPNFFQAYLPYIETTQSIGLPANYMRAPKTNFAPRVGFAYQPWDNTVIRGGYGIYYDFRNLYAEGNDWNSIPFGSNTSTANSKLPGKPTSTFLPDVTFANPFGSAGVNTSLNPGLYYNQPNVKNAMIQQYNLTVERQVRQNWMGRVSYVGSETQQLPWVSFDMNLPFVQTPNQPEQVSRPHQPWSTITGIRTGGTQSFNQLQLEGIRRYSDGTSLQVEYSWTRSLDNAEFTGNPQRWYLPAADYGNTTTARTHSLVVVYLYELPFGHGKALLHDSPRPVNALVGGWQVTGITNYGSGTPFSVNFAVPSSEIGWLGGRAQRIPGVPLYKRQSGHNVFRGVSWFNPAAFGPPQPWTWGNSGRNILWGPGEWNWDMSALKLIPLHENRVQMTFRADFLNAFNHFNLGNPNATVASTQYGGVPEPNAGLITTGSGNRTIQLGLALKF